MLEHAPTCELKMYEFPDMSDMRFPLRPTFQSPIDMFPLSPWTPTRPPIKLEAATNTLSVDVFGSVLTPDNHRPMLNSLASISLMDTCTSATTFTGYPTLLIFIVVR